MYDGYCPTCEKQVHGQGNLASGAMYCRRCGTQIVEPTELSRPDLNREIKYLKSRGWTHVQTTMSSGDGCDFGLLFTRERDGRIQRFWLNHFTINAPWKAISCQVVPE